MASRIVENGSEEGFSFNHLALEWIAEGSGIDEEICGVDKECIVVPSSPDLPKLERIDEEDYVEIQVTEEEVITDHWVHNNGLLDFSSDIVGSLSLQSVSSSDGVAVPLVEDHEEEYVGRFPCDFCNLRFNDEATLNTHMLKHQSSRLNDCNICGEGFKRKSDLVEHMKLHTSSPKRRKVDYVKIKRKSKTKKIKFDKNKKSSIAGTHQKRFGIVDPSRPYVCQYCGVGFAREKALISHKLIHAGDLVIQCDKCREIFDNESLLDEHMKAKHTNNTAQKKQYRSTSPLITPYYPSAASPVPPSAGSLQQPRVLSPESELPYLSDNVDSDRAADIETGTVEDGFPCPSCNIVFSTMNEVLCHKEDHDPDVGIHTCYLCSGNFVNIEGLCAHIRRAHRETNACNHCDKIFKDQFALQKHVFTHFQSKFACHMCPRVFQNKFSLKRHLTSHEEKPPMSCAECGSDNFSDGSSLLYHRQIEHGVDITRLFPCPECGKTFNSRSSQQIHIRIHTGERPYGCRFCWKAFGDGGTLRKHERIHTGEKPYVCPVCAKAFNQRVVLREHVRAHHSGSVVGRPGETCLECIVCGEGFTSSVDLCAHLVHHSDENTAKHRLPSARRTVISRKKPSQPLDALPDEKQTAKVVYTPSLKRRISVEPPMEITSEVLCLSEPDSNISTLRTKSGKKPRIIRSGDKGFMKGQNKRFLNKKDGTKGKTNRLSNSSYASKYVVSQPQNNQIPPNSDDVGDSSTRTRPRTKNVSYHNMREGARYSTATFPYEEKSWLKSMFNGNSPSSSPVSTPKKKKKKKKKSIPMSNTKSSASAASSVVKNELIISDAFEHVSENGVDECDELEQIETSIVDDLGFDIKIEPESHICQMCGESFNTSSDLFRHIQIHI